MTSVVPATYRRDRYDRPIVIGQDHLPDEIRYTVTTGFKVIMELMAVDNVHRTRTTEPFAADSSAAKHARTASRASSGVTISGLLPASRQFAK